MGIMDFFSKATTDTPAQTDGSQAQQGTAGAGISNQQATATPQGKMEGTEQTLENPLDVYSKLFDNANKSTESAPSFSLDDKVLTEASGKMKFTDGINPELMQKATNGDASALIQLMNQVGQNAYKASLAHSSALTDKFVAARSEFDLKNVGTKVKSELTQSELSSVPNASHPVIKRELNRVADSMRAANPDASPQEIAKAAQKYVQDIAEALSGKTAPDPAALKEGETDWSKYLE